MIDYSDDVMKTFNDYLEDEMVEFIKDKELESATAKEIVLNPSY